MIEALALAAYIYTVKSGDTLWAIAPNHDWVPVCQENHLADCNLIYPGQKLRVGGASLTVSIQYNDNDSDGDDQSSPVRSSESPNSPVTGRSALSGTLGCSGLESLWMSAGGNAGSAFIAAEIAEAESGGQQYAAGDGGSSLGYWQINAPSWGSLATYDPYGNARAAVIISGNGSNWTPWTTYVTGAYIGRC
jgi:hypothetical protein